MLDHAHGTEGRDRHGRKVSRLARSCSRSRGIIFNEGLTGQIAGTAAGVPPDYAGHFSRIAGGDEIIRVAESFADFLSTRPTRE